MLQQKILQHVLHKVLGAACPSTIPRSGKDGEQVNCYVATLRNGNEPDFVLLNQKGSTINGLRFDGTRFAIDDQINVRSINPSELEITHFYGLDTITYSGVWDFLRGRIFRAPYFLVHLHRIKQSFSIWLFNRRSLSSKRVSDTLREIVDANLNGKESLDAMAIMTLRYGPLWAVHPEWEKLYDELSTTLKLLADAGDLREVNHAYSATGQALKTLEEVEREERRHIANYRIQLWLAVFALASAAMAAAQANLIKVPTLLDLSSRTKSQTDECRKQAQNPPKSSTRPSLNGGSTLTPT